MINAEAPIKNFVLIDFENVKPKSLSSLKAKKFRVYLFTGAQQPVIDLELAKQMHEIGTNRSEYITLSETGKNALDFHITYYLGQLVAKNPNAHFHIITKDKGFDPLIRHLKKSSIKVDRYVSINAISTAEKIDNTDVKIMFKTVVKNLSGRGSSKPKTEQTLKNTIRSMFTDGFRDSDLTALFNMLKQAKYIVLKGEKVSYNLPERT